LFVGGFYVINLLARRGARQAEKAAAQSTDIPASLSPTTEEDSIKTTIAE